MESATEVRRAGRSRAIIAGVADPGPSALEEFKFLMARVAANDARQIEAGNPEHRDGHGLDGDEEYVARLRTTGRRAYADGYVLLRRRQLARMLKRGAGG